MTTTHTQTASVTVGNGTKIHQATRITAANGTTSWWTACNGNARRVRTVDLPADCKTCLAGTQAPTVEAAPAVQYEVRQNLRSLGWNVYHVDSTWLPVRRDGWNTEEAAQAHADRMNKIGVTS